MATGQASSPAPLRGTLCVPGDKSLSHRAVLFSAMAEGTSHLCGVLDSFDVRASIEAVRQLGAQVDLAPEDTAAPSAGLPSGGGRSKKRDHPLSGTITGWGSAGPQVPVGPLDCGNSGTTTRLLLGMLSGYPIDVTLQGDVSLSTRPMGRVTGPLTQMGATFIPTDTLPITVRGTAALRGIDYHSPVASAQVKSALLLAGLHARGTTRVTEPHRSRDHTELLLPAFGVSIGVEETTASVEGGQQLTSCECTVPGDPSSAAFPLIAAALIPDSAVCVERVSLNPTRTGFVNVMKRMGVAITSDDAARERSSGTGSWGNEKIGTLSVTYRDRLSATEVLPDEIPSLIDEIPVLALLATAAEGTTIFRSVGELRVKESDRLSALVDALLKVGCDAFARDDDLYVVGGVPTVSALLDSQGDHRLAMTWVLIRRCFGLAVEITDLSCIGVSYPSFLEDMDALEVADFAGER